MSSAGKLPKYKPDHRIKVVVFFFYIFHGACKLAFKFRSKALSRHHSPITHGNCFRKCGPLKSTSLGFFFLYRVVSINNNTTEINSLKWQYPEIARPYLNPPPFWTWESAADNLFPSGTFLQFNKGDLNLLNSSSGSLLLSHGYTNYLKENSWGGVWRLRRLEQALALAANLRGRMD